MPAAAGASTGSAPVSAWFDATLFGAVFVTLFVIMDPLGSIPLFLGLTGGRPGRFGLATRAGGRRLR